MPKGWLARPAAAVCVNRNLVPAAGMAALRAYWDWLQAEVPALHAAGLSCYRAAVQLVGSPTFRQSSWATWHEPERIVGNVAGIYRNLDGRGGELSPIALVQVFSPIARLARHLRETGWFVRP